MFSDEPGVAEEAGAALEQDASALLAGTSAELPGTFSELETLFGAAAEELTADDAGASPELDTPGTLLEEVSAEEISAEEATAELEVPATSEEETGVSSAFAIEESSPQAARKATERAKSASTEGFI